MESGRVIQWRQCVAANEIKDGEFVKDHRFLFPFSPQIYQSTFTSSDLNILQELAENSRNSIRWGNSLSGNIQEQRVVESMNQEVLSILAPHIQEYIKFESEEENLNYNNLNFAISSFWFNYMRKNEFNPLHAHSGFISGVLMIKVPEEISQEHISIPIESNARCPGMLEWVSLNRFYRQYPVEGEIYLFPANLQHQVYPFASDVERITASFNISEIDFS